MGAVENILGVGFVGLLGYAGYKKYQKANEGETNTSGGSSGTTSQLANAYTQDKNNAPIPNVYYTTDASEGDNYYVYADDMDTKKEVSSQTPTDTSDGANANTSGSTRITEGGVKVYSNDFIGPIEKGAVREGQVYADNFVGPLQQGDVRESTTKKEAESTYEQPASSKPAFNIWKPSTWW